MKAAKNISLVYGFLAILFWSTAATAFKLALGKLHLTQVLLVATLTSTVALFFIIVYKKLLLEIKRDLKTKVFNGLIAGLLNPIAYYLILFKAYTLIPAQIAQPLNFIWPITLVLLSALLLKEKISTQSILALIISFIGVVIISLQGNFSTLPTGNITGISLALGSSIIWAFYWIWNMKCVGHEIVKLFFGFLWGSLIITIIYFLNPINFNWNTSGVLYSIYIGLFEMGITFALWLTALTISKSTKQLSNIVYLVPFLSLIFIALVLKEDIYFTTFLGLMLIICGIVIQRIRK